MEEKVLDHETKPEKTDDHQDDRELMMIPPKEIEFEDGLNRLFRLKTIQETTIGSSCNLIDRGIGSNSSSGGEGVDGVRRFQYLLPEYETGEDDD